MLKYRMPFRLTAAPDDDQRRLDRILRIALPGMPLSALHRLLRKGRITVDGIKAGPQQKIRAGQVIEIISENVPHRDIRPPVCEPNREDKKLNFDFHSVPPRLYESKLNIIYEGCGLLILNKPAGLAVHGEDSLDEQVQSYLAPKLNPSLSFRPGPLHRLDKPTTGLIVFSTSLNGARFFSAMLGERKIRKQYLALLDGAINNDETWEDDLLREGKTKRAITKVNVIAASAKHSLILAEIPTGITHQIRAQASIHGHPLTGDRKYGSPNKGPLLLHAWKLDFNNPDFFHSEPAVLPSTKTSDPPKSFEAPLPELFLERIERIFGKVAIMVNVV